MYKSSSLYFVVYFSATRRYFNAKFHILRLFGVSSYALQFNVDNVMSIAMRNILSEKYRGMKYDGIIHCRLVKYRGIYSLARLMIHTLPTMHNFPSFLLFSVINILKCGRQSMLYCHTAAQHAQISVCVSIFYI